MAGAGSVITLAQAKHLPEALKLLLQVLLQYISVLATPERGHARRL